MKECGKTLALSRDGVSRGKCTRPAGHTCNHMNGICNMCGVAPRLVKKSICYTCLEKWRRQRYGQKPLNYQIPGNTHKFPCGCSGKLPKENEESNNKFVRLARKDGWYCRVARILSESTSKKGLYKPIDKNTPHFVIRKLMEDKDCWRCRKPLKWVFGAGQTPHLHHNHITGEIYGFTHPRCNPNSLEHEVDELRQRIAELIKAAE